MNEYMQNETQDVNVAAEEPKETMPEHPLFPGIP